MGINLPHIVFQPIEGEVQYKTADVTPVYWFHYTPDILVVPEASPYKTFAEFIAAAKKTPGKMNLGGSGLNSANHAAHERLNAAFGIKSTYVPYNGRHGAGGAGQPDRRGGDLCALCDQQQVQGARPGRGHGQAPPADA
jgi:tripartite-type tricarboxylate transporter receptor subunit TctC